MSSAKYTAWDAPIKSGSVDGQPQRRYWKKQAWPRNVGVVPVFYD